MNEVYIPSLQLARSRKPQGNNREASLTCQFAAPILTYQSENRRGSDPAVHNSRCFCSLESGPGASNPRQGKPEEGKPEEGNCQMVTHTAEVNDLISTDKRPSPDIHIRTIRAFIERLTGSPNTPMCWRFISDSKANRARDRAWEKAN